MNDLAVSRRAVTRAIVTLPALAAAPALAATTIRSDAALKTAWNKLMAEYLAAKHIADEYDRLHFNPLHQAQKAKFGPGLLLQDEAKISDYKAWRQLHNADEIEDRFEEYGEAEANARGVLLYASAPDHAALRWKLDATFDEQDGIQYWRDEITAVIRADIARLLPAGGVA